MYNSFVKLVNSTSSKKAFEKINNFPEYTPFLEKPIQSYPIYNEQNLLLATNEVNRLMGNDLCDYCLPQMLCIDVGAKPSCKKHNYIIFGYYHS